MKHVYVQLNIFDIMYMVLRRTPTIHSSIIINVCIHIVHTILYFTLNQSFLFTCIPYVICQLSFYCNMKDWHNEVSLPIFEIKVRIFFCM